MTLGHTTRENHPSSGTENDPKTDTVTGAAGSVGGSADAPSTVEGGESTGGNPETPDTVDGGETIEGSDADSTAGANGTE